MTGAGGYLGSRIATDLTGPTVRAVVRRRVPYLPADQQVELDLAGDPQGVAAVFDGVGAVIHLAGHNEVVAGDDPERSRIETVRATERVAEAAAAAGVARLVYVSTVHVYGARITDDAVLTEDLPPQPTSTYATARWDCERVLARTDLDVVVLRLTNAVGPPADVRVDRWTLVASDLCRQATRAGTLELRSAGLQWRDFVDLADVSRIVGACADPGGVAAGTYNLGTGRCMTVRRLAELVQDAFEHHTGRRPELHAPPPQGPPPRPYRVAVDRLAAQGMVADAPVAAAVDRLTRYCLEHKDEL